MDASAVSLCRENKIPILVFSLHSEGEFSRVLSNVGTYTIISDED